MVAFFGFNCVLRDDKKVAEARFDFMG
jgi:hypothetical protein